MNPDELDEKGEELAELLEALMSDTATSAQQARWKQLCTEQPERTSLLHEHARMDVRLRALCTKPDPNVADLADRVFAQVDRENTSTGNNKRFTPTPDKNKMSAHRHSTRLTPRTRPPTRWVPYLAIAACLAIAATFLFTMTSPADVRSGGPTAAAYAQIQQEEANTVVMVNGQPMTIQQTPLSTGSRVAISAGSARLTFPDGTRCLLASGTVLRVGPDAPGTTLQLEHGQLDTEVTPQPAGKPLRISTTQAIITVVGTSFILTTDADRTILAMRTGKVFVTAFSASGDGISRTLGDGISVTAGQRAEVLTGQPPRIIDAEQTAPRVVRIQASADSYTRVWQPQASDGGELILAVKQGPEDPMSRGRDAYLRFPTSALSENIIKAVLELQVLNPGTPARHGLFATTAAWSETQLCWDNHPPISVSLIAEWLVNAPGPIRIDVTADVQARWKTGLDWCIRSLDDVGDGGMCAYKSRESSHPAFRPQLTVTLGTK